MNTVSRGNDEKLYSQLYKLLKNRILSGEWPAGTVIPSEKELCKMYGVSGATAKTSIAFLVKQGLLVRKQGKGTMVIGNKEGFASRVLEEFAHQINNPLAVINEKAGWMNDLMKEENREKIKHYDEYVEVLSRIRHQIFRIQMVSQDITGLPGIIQSLKRNRGKDSA